MLAQARRGGCRSEKATKRCLEGLCGRYGKIASGVLATQTIVCGRALLSHSTDPSALLHGVGCLGALLRSVRISGRARTRGDGAGMRCSCAWDFSAQGVWQRGSAAGRLPGVVVRGCCSGSKVERLRCACAGAR